MTSAELLSVRDEARWGQALPASESVFGSVEFAALQRDHRGADPRLFVLDAPHGPIAHPLFLRPVSGLDLEAGSSRDLFDASTPEYTGPLAAGALDDAARRAFADELSSWCAATGIVTEFGHLHPWKARTELLVAAAIEREREIVYVDLTQDPERMWRESFTHAARKNVKRARREGVRVYAATSEADVRELHRIYTLTMDRQGASERHYFPYEYFAAIRERLPDNSRILLAEHDGRVVAATLYLYDSADVYSYLGGADHDAQRVRPTNAIVDEMIRWARAQGKQRLILGGGYSPGDRDLPLQVELLAAASFLPGVPAGAHPGRLRRPCRGVARAARRRGHGPGVLPSLPGAAAGRLERDGLGALPAKGVAEGAERVERRCALVAVAPQHVRPRGRGDLVWHVGVGEEQHSLGVRVEHPLDRELVFLGEVGAVLELDPAVLERVHEMARIGCDSERAVRLRIGIVVTRGRWVGVVLRGRLVGRDVVVSLIREIESQIAASLPCGHREPSLLDRRRRSPNSAIGFDSKCGRESPLCVNVRLRG